MTLSATAIVIAQDNVDTDVLYPGKYLAILDPVKAAEHLFEGLDPSLRALLRKGPSVLFVGDNFGTGSSREQPVTAMKASGVLCIVGQSFARIFARNAVNSGMPAFTNPDAVRAVEPGQAVEVDLDTGTIRLGTTDFRSVPIAALPREIIRAGGLVPWVKIRRVAQASSEAAEPAGEAR